MLLIVMPGLVPGIHVFTSSTAKTWMAGTSPAMTAKNDTFSFRTHFARFSEFRFSVGQELFALTNR
jgi:hypothetical protein